MSTPNKTVLYIDNLRGDCVCPVQIEARYDDVCCESLALVWVMSVGTNTKYMSPYTTYHSIVTGNIYLRWITVRAWAEGNTISVCWTRFGDPGNFSQVSLNIQRINRYDIIHKLHWNWMYMPNFIADCNDRCGNVATTGWQFVFDSAFRMT